MGEAINLLSSDLFSFVFFIGHQVACVCRTFDFLVLDGAHFNRHDKTASLTVIKSV